MKIASDNAALALTQAASPDAAAAKRRASLETAQKSKANADPRTPVDTVELSETKPAAQVSRSEAQKAQGEQNDPLAALFKSFGARSGDAGFDAALDANGDGIINFADLNAALNGGSQPVTGGPQPVEPNPNAANAGALNADEGNTLGESVEPALPQPVTGGPQPVEPDPNAANPGALNADEANEIASADAASEDEDGPAVFTADDIDLALAAFGSAEGDEAFNGAYDFDGDGTINFSDLNELLSRFNNQSQTQQTLIEQLTERFGATDGDQGFNPNLDFDGDGTINFSDLNTLLSNLSRNTNGGE